MNFYPNPSGITSQETFLATRYIQRPVKNPLFEVISLRGPTGPLPYQFFLGGFYQDIIPTC
jgi:hypothetical protein